MAFTGERLMQGIDSYVSKAISRLSYNTTELCTVSQVNNDGSYQVTNGAVSFVAWSAQGEYAQNDSVYVLVPNGTHDAECMILRKKTTDQDIKVQRVSPKDNIAIIGDNLKDLGEAIAADDGGANTITIEDKNLYREDFTRHRLNRLYIKFKSYAEVARAALSPSSVLSQGSYTIQLKMIIEDNQEITFNILSEELEGNLFASEDAATEQEACWGINYDKILQAIQLEDTDLYQEVGTGEIKHRTEENEDPYTINLIPTGFSVDVVYGSGIDAYGNAVSNINSGSTGITIKVEVEEIYFGIDPGSFDGTQIDVWWTDEQGNILSTERESYGVDDWTADDEGNIQKWYARACIYYKDSSTEAVTRINNEQELLDFQKEVQLKWYINDSTMYKVAGDPTSEAGWLLLENESSSSSVLDFAFTPKKSLVYHLRTLQLRAALYVDKIAQDGYSNILSADNGDYALRNIIRQEDGFNIQAEDNYNGKFFVYQLDGNLIQDFNNDVRYLSVFYNSQNIFDWAAQNLEVGDTIELKWFTADSNYIVKDERTNDTFKFRKKDNLLLEKIINKIVDDEELEEIEEINREELLEETKFVYKLANQLFIQTATSTISCVLKKNDKVVTNLLYAIILGQDTGSRSGINFQIFPKNYRRPVVIEDKNEDNILTIGANLFKDGIDISDRMSEAKVDWSWAYPKKKENLWLSLISNHIINDKDCPFENQQTSLTLNNYYDGKTKIISEEISEKHPQKYEGYSETFFVLSSLVNNGFEIEVGKQLSNIINGARVADITVSIQKRDNNGEWQTLTEEYSPETGIFRPAAAGAYRVKFDFSGNTGYLDCSEAKIDDTDSQSIKLQEISSKDNLSPNLFIEINNPEGKNIEAGPIEIKSNDDDENEVVLGYIFSLSRESENKNENSENEGENGENESENQDENSETEGENNEKIEVLLKKNERTDDNVEHFEGSARPGDKISGFGCFPAGDWYESVNYKCDINFDEIQDSTFYFQFNSFKNDAMTTEDEQTYQFNKDFFYFKHQFLTYFKTSPDLICPSLDSDESDQRTTDNFECEFLYDDSDGSSDYKLKINYNSVKYEGNSLVLAFSFSGLNEGDWESPDDIPIYYYENNINSDSVFKNAPTARITSLAVKNTQSEEDPLSRMIVPKDTFDKKEENNYHILKAELTYQKEKLTAYLPIGYCNITSLSEFNNYQLSDSTNYYYSLDNNLRKDDQQFREFKLLNLNEPDSEFKMFLRPEDAKDTVLPSIAEAAGDAIIPNFRIVEITENEKTVSYKIDPCSWYDENNEISLLIKFEFNENNENEYFWIQPLFQIRNSNFSTLVNSWSGETETDLQSVRTSLGVFGSKNDWNKFTGVILGEMPLLEGCEGYPPGIYGYKSEEDKTENTFYINTNGDAYLKGTVKAKAGEIGGLVLENGKLYNNNSDDEHQNKWYGMATEFGEKSTIEDRKDLVKSWGKEYFLVAGSRDALSEDVNWKVGSNNPPEKMPNFFVSDQGALYAQQANLFPSTIRLYNEKDEDLTYKNKSSKWLSLGEWVQVEYEMVELMRWLDWKRKSNTLLYFLRQLINANISENSDYISTNKNILSQSDLKANRSVEILRTILQKEFKWDKYNLKITYKNLNPDQIIVSTSGDNNFIQLSALDEKTQEPINKEVWSSNVACVLFSDKGPLDEDSSGGVAIAATYPPGGTGNVLVFAPQSPKDRYFNKLFNLLQLFKLNDQVDPKRIDKDSSVSEADNYEYDFGYADMNFEEWVRLFNYSEESEEGA